MNSQGYTTSNRFQVKDNDTFFRILRGRFRLNARLTEGYISPDGWCIRGENTFSVYAIDPDSPDDADYNWDRTDEFLEMLRDHLALGQQAVIQSIEHEGARFPFIAVSYVITPEGIRRHELETGEEKPEKPGLICPKCGCRKFQYGPAGGGCQNVRCENGHCWNLVGPFAMEDIGENTDGAPGCTCKQEEK